MGYQILQARIDKGVPIPGPPGSQGPAGPQGAPGPQGPPGPSSSVFHYTADAHNQGASDPGSGKVRWNTTGQIDATFLYFDWLTSDGFDANAIFKLMGPPSQFIVQDKDLAINYQVWEMTGAVVMMPDWFQVPVHLVDQGGNPVMAHNKGISVIIVGGGGGSATPPVDVMVDGALVGHQPVVEFLAGPNVGLAGLNNSSAGKVEITVTSFGGSAAAGGSPGHIQVNQGGALTGYSTLTYDGKALKTTAVEPSDQGAWNFLCQTHNLEATPNFSNSCGMIVQENVYGGYYNYDNTTQAKSTTFAGYFGLTCSGASQAFALAVHVDKWSMGDCGAHNGWVSYRGGPLSGDEGQCYQCFTYLVQDQYIVTTTILAVKRSACPANMTVTQNVTASKDPQTINVSSTAGIVADDYLVAGQSSDTGPQHVRHVQVISVTPTTLTAVISVNMASGDPLKPALVLTVNQGPGRFGQLIPIVNLSGATISAGTVSSINGGEFNGTGTAWAENMVGGDSLNIGAVSLVNDNDTVTPFDSTPPEAGGHMLRSWYQIWYVTGAAKLGINSYSVAGNRGYRGNGAGAGSYLIKPAARALWFPPSTWDVVCEYSPHTWNVGDIIESTMCPYPDVSLQLWNMSAYTPGGSYRGGISIGNYGHRMFDACYSAISGMPVGAHDAPWGWGAGLWCSGCKVGVNVDQPLTAAMWITTTDFSHNGNIQWHGDGSLSWEGAIGMYGNQWDPSQMVLGSGSVTLEFARSSVTGYQYGEVVCNGNLTINSPNTASLVYLQLGGKTSSGGGPVTGAYPLHMWRIETTPGSGDGTLYVCFRNDYYNLDTKVFGFLQGDGQPGQIRGMIAMSRDVATSTQNFGSYPLLLGTSIWDGTAPDIQYTLIRSDVTPDGRNTFNVAIARKGDAYLEFYPRRVLTLSDAGELSIGSVSPYTGAGHTVTFDPTGATANRTITIPDASGVMALTSDLSTPPTSTFQIFPTETVPPGTTNNTYTQTRGYKFQVTKPLLVSALGRPYLAADTQDHFIGLWNADTHVLLASGTILKASASDTHGFKYVAASALLAPGVNYTIATSESAGGDFTKDAFTITDMVTSVIVPVTGMYSPAGGVDIEPVNPGDSRAWVGQAITFAAGLTTGLATFDPSHLTAPRTITIPDASGTMALLPLPSASPGSGKLWYDPADSNRVKYTP